MRRVKLAAAAVALATMDVGCTAPEVRWHVDAGAAREGVAQWAAHASSLGAITGLYGCCDRFNIVANGSFFDGWPSTYPLSDWDFVHDLGLTMHFVFKVDQLAFMNGTALLAIPDAVRTAVVHNFTGYAMDYELTPAGPPGSEAFKNESDAILEFVTLFAARLQAAGKELVVDMGGTAATTLSVGTSSQRALAQRWASSGVPTLMDMMTYYGTDLGFNQRWLTAAMNQGGIPAHMLSSGIGSSTTAGCGCGAGSRHHQNRSCCAPTACCGPSQSPWAQKPPIGPPSCVGAPCGGCNTLGTDLPCFNWTASSLRKYATFLAQHQINKIGIFMATIDRVDNPSTEGNNATAPFFYEIMRDFIAGTLLARDGSSSIQQA